MARLLRLRIPASLSVLALAACSSTNGAKDDERTSRASAEVVTRAGAMNEDNPACADATLRRQSTSGVVVHDAKVHVIPWIPAGNTTAAAAPMPNTTVVQQFVSDFMSLPLASILAEYPDATLATRSVTFSEQHTLTAAYATTGTLTDPLSKSDIESAIDADAKNTSTATDDVYLVLLPRGVHACHHSPIKLTGGTVDNASDCSIGDSTGVTGGWHDTTPGGRTYAIALGSSWLASGGIAPNDLVTDAYLNTISHELFETFTDPQVGQSWTTSGACGSSEIGDLCVDRPSFFQVGATRAYSIQSEWSNARAACADLGPTCTGYWTCSGAQTDAVLQCPPLPAHSHYQLLRKTSTGMLPVVTTVPLAGVLGRNPNDPIDVHELGYAPTALEVSLTYEVCVVDEWTNTSVCGATTIATNNNACGACVPATSCGTTCGTTISDGCGGTITCGACADGSACVSGVCKGSSNSDCTPAMARRHLCS